MNAGDRLSPLERILQAERDAERRLREAEEGAAAQLARARQQAAATKADAVQRGRQQGQAEHDAILEAAHREAAEIVDQARQRAASLTATPQAYVPAMVERILAIVLGRVRAER
ncbi:MAG: hypothetical protein HPY64_17255 [Anaerolineae bacterium]|nr:hypothetical protein [Anaerolineae bacterium]